jgi:hypothetical protein
MPRDIDGEKCQNVSETELTYDSAARSSVTGYTRSAGRLIRLAHLYRQEKLPR